MTPIRQLQPGDCFTAASGTSWQLERHAGDVSWAVRVAVPGEEPEWHWVSCGPVGVGERDRFGPDAKVEVWT